MFNETFAPLGGKRQGKGMHAAVIWHEATVGRDAQDIASSYQKMIRDPLHMDYKDFTIWTDNCIAQNKNWYSVTITFLEAGHTYKIPFMRSADKSGKKKWFNFHDFINVNRKAKGNPIVIDYGDFGDWPKGFSHGRWTQNKPYLKDVVEVKFKKGSKIYWKPSLESGVLAEEISTQSESKKEGRDASNTSGKEIQHHTKTH